MTGTDASGGAAPARIAPRLFVYAAVGVSLGLSDVWRFPQMLAEHASPWFPVVYLAGLALIGVPLLVAELALARLGHSRPAVNLGFTVAGTRASPLWQYAGLVVLAAVFLILSCTMVIADWLMAYTVRSFVGGLDDATPGSARLLFQSLITDPERLLGWHTLFAVGLGSIAARDFDTGAGRFSRRLVSAVFAVAVLLAGLSLYHHGLAPAHVVDWPAAWSSLSGALVLDAVTQAFFTLGVCMGAMLILGHYLPSEARAAPLVLTVVAADVLFVSLAAAGVVPILLSSGSGAGGVAFAMETVPLALAGIPLARLYLGAFYGLLFLLVATTALVLMELLVAWLSGRTGRPRASVAPMAAAAVWFGGVLALLSFGVLAFEFEFVGAEKSFGLFDVMDILSSQILLPIIGLLMAVFVGWNIDRQRFAAAMGPGRAAEALHWLKRYLVPTVVGVILIFLVFGRALSRV